MNNLIERMRARIQQIADPNDPYSQRDFDIEFANSSEEYLSELDGMEESYQFPISFTNKSNNPDPEYATSGSSGFDLRANLTEPMTIPAGKRGIVNTGLYFELPQNFEIQVRPRSGLAAKNGVTVLNTPGTIDSDYRGEIMVILINLGENDFVINHGDRIAQGVVSAVTAKNFIKLQNVSEINTDTERGAGKFGSTGVN
jgi:dUTP pyrophosphatase